MFRDGPIDGVVLKSTVGYEDHRGHLIELFRRDEMSADVFPQMAYVSETLPGAVRGPHEHLEQSDLFAFVGPGDLTLFFWDDRPDSPTRGNRQKLVAGQSSPQLVFVPPRVVHAYKNEGEVPAWVLNFPNRLYRGPGRQSPVDEVRHEDRRDSPYGLF